MKLVEQELWQREEKGLIGILPVRDTAGMTTVGPLLSQGDCNFPFVGGCSIIYSPMYLESTPFGVLVYYLSNIRQRDKGTKEKLFLF